MTGENVLSFFLKDNLDEEETTNKPENDNDNNLETIGESWDKEIENVISMIENKFKENPTITMESNKPQNKNNNSISISNPINSNRNLNHNKLNNKTKPQMKKTNHSKKISAVKLKPTSAMSQNNQSLKIDDTETTNFLETHNQSIQTSVPIVATQDTFNIHNLPTYNNDIHNSQASLQFSPPSIQNQSFQQFQFPQNVNQTQQNQFTNATMHYSQSQPNLMHQQSAFLGNNHLNTNQNGNNNKTNTVFTKAASQRMFLFV